MDQYPAVRGIKRSIRISEIIGLIIIAIATVIAGIQEVLVMVDNMKVTLGDLLLLFLYLEVLAMVAIYMDSGKLPIRFPMYIAIIALARYLILDMKNLTEWQMIAVAATMLMIAAAVIILRYGHLKLPYTDRKQLEDNLKK
ncbi:phosphate-starvation-inducible PsiE family protein [Hydrogenovibrio sp. 3SP14C1]|uniref:phosphate-starvation-inducible PsiE family protein n=1 Tax=Hydrogenovibrio sp. 3SP14C1 TaxID=3038774 RepID=UPI002417DC9D|nr:phosphate-starvation-inducible PsiE family protein [Hydrogenovibrio sp. 3SP14C1]MDG4812141.1 phosphate-starvation-inducible PsiE family protein [Hydrogenovibrio sp. 3SP14C1]